MMVAAAQSLPLRGILVSGSQRNSCEATKNEEELSNPRSARK